MIRCWIMGLKVVTVIKFVYGISSYHTGRLFKLFILLYLHYRIGLFWKYSSLELGKPKYDFLDKNYTFFQYKDHFKAFGGAAVWKRLISVITKMKKKSKYLNLSLQKQIIFSTDHLKYSRNIWVEKEKDLSISKMPIEKLVQNK